MLFIFYFLKNVTASIGRYMHTSSRPLKLGSNFHEICFASVDRSVAPQVPSLGSLSFVKCPCPSTTVQGSYGTLRHSVQTSIYLHSPYVAVLKPKIY